MFIAVVSKKCNIVKHFNTILYYKNCNNNFPINSIIRKKKFMW